MRTCIVCHFGDIGMDDVAVVCGAERCICVACFSRTVEGERRVSKTLQRDINSETSPQQTIERDHESAAMERPM